MVVFLYNHKIFFSVVSKLHTTNFKCGMLKNVCSQICISDSYDLVHLDTCWIYQDSFLNGHQLGRVYSLHLHFYEQFLWKFQRKTLFKIYPWLLTISYLKQGISKNYFKNMNFPSFKHLQFTITFHEKGMQKNLHVQVGGVIVFCRLIIIDQFIVCHTSMKSTVLCY